MKFTAWARWNKLVFSAEIGRLHGVDLELSRTSTPRYSGFTLRIIQILNNKTKDIPLTVKNLNEAKKKKKKKKKGLRCSWQAYYTDCFHLLVCQCRGPSRPANPKMRAFSLTPIEPWSAAMNAGLISRHPRHIVSLLQL